MMRGARDFPVAQSPGTPLPFGGKRSHPSQLRKPGNKPRVSSLRQNSCLQLRPRSSIQDLVFPCDRLRAEVIPLTFVHERRFVGRWIFCCLVCGLCLGWRSFPPRLRALRSCFLYRRTGRSSYGWPQSIRGRVDFPGSRADCAGAGRVRTCGYLSIVMLPLSVIMWSERHYVEIRQWRAAP